MKKNIAFFLTLALVTFSLTACSGTATQSLVDDAPAQTDVDTPSDVQKNEMSLKEEYPDFKTFDISASETAAIIKRFMQQQYPDSMTIEPTVDDVEGDELIPPNKTYTYDIGSGVSLTLFETQKPQKLYQAYLYTPKSTDATSDALSRVGTASGLLLGLLEPEEEVGQRIMTELNVTDTETSGSRFSLGEQSYWTYMVDEKSLTFNVMAK